MDRRAFVAAGAASGLALAAVTETAPAAPAPPIPRPGPVDDMDAYLATVDAGMERIGRWSVTDGYPGFTGDREATDALARTAMQTLYLTGMFGDLPREQQLHPGMQERMWAALPLMDDALERMNGFLRSRPDQELDGLQTVLDGPHHVADRIADVLDAEAAASGVSDWRRQQLRGMVAQAAWRLAHQPPGLMLQEYADKIERVDASDIAVEARRRWLASRVGEQVFWVRAGVTEGLVTSATLAEEPRSLRERRIARGAKSMGVGVLIFAAGVALATIGGDSGGAATGFGLVTGTVGAIWFLVGFLTLLVGLATSEQAGEPRPSPKP